MSKPHAFLIAAMCGLPCAHAADLQLEVTVPAGRTGAVMLSLFDKAEGFPRGKALKTARVEPKDGRATVTFNGLPPGDYAASVYFDENGNFKLDTNAFGMPSELYGFSRNARGSGGPPAFADAAFRLEEGSKPHTIDLAP